jgi:hypothetical protein
MSSRIPGLLVALITILPVLAVMVAHGRRWVGLG